MGKGSRSKALRRARNRRASDKAWYHGGVPGLQTDDVIVSAAELGTAGTFRYRQDHAGLYDPEYVYITTDQDMAFNFAARYLSPNGTRRPGDVYEVQPIGPTTPDTDYSSWPSIFRRCGSARIVRVVQAGANATPDDLIRRTARYFITEGLDGQPQRTFNDDGIIQLPAELAGHGVTQEYLDLIKPWLNPARLGGDGSIGPEPPDATMTVAKVLEVFPRLDTGDHRITRTDTPNLQCERCSRSWPLAQQGLAALHQIGEGHMRVVLRFNPKIAPGPVDAISYFRRKHPVRWAWLENRI